MMETMYDLAIARGPDGCIRLEQSAGSLEEPAVIDLHPMQVRLIAERAGLLAPQLMAGAVPNGLARRLRGLHERIKDFYFENPYFVQILERCGDGAEIVGVIGEIYAWSTEVIADLSEIEATSGASIRNRSSLASDAAQDGELPIKEPTLKTAAQPDAGQLSITLE